MDTITSFFDGWYLYRRNRQGNFTTAAKPASGAFVFAMLRHKHPVTVVFSDGTEITVKPGEPTPRRVAVVLLGTTGEGIFDMAMTLAECDRVVRGTL